MKTCKDCPLGTTSAMVIHTVQNWGRMLKDIVVRFYCSFIGKLEVGPGPNLSWSGYSRPCHGPWSRDAGRLFNFRVWGSDYLPWFTSTEANIVQRLQKLKGWDDKACKRVIDSLSEEKSPQFSFKLDVKNHIILNAESCWYYCMIGSIFEQVTEDLENIKPSIIP